MGIQGPDDGTQITAADLEQIVASDKLEELCVYQAPVAAAAAAGDFIFLAHLNWLSGLQGLRHLVFDGEGREALIFALPALTALTYLKVYMVKEQEEEAPLPLDSCPALRELFFDSYHDFDRVLAHLGNCNPLTGLACLDLWECKP